jgi:hypothetical protein
MLTPTVVLLGWRPDDSCGRSFDKTPLLGFCDSVRFCGVSAAFFVRGAVTGAAFSVPDEQAVVLSTSAATRGRASVLSFIVLQD